MQMLNTKLMAKYFLMIVVAAFWITQNTFPQANGKIETNTFSIDDHNIVTYKLTGTETQNSDNVNYTYAGIILNGFPVQASFTAGTYHGGPAVNTVVEEITSDNKLQIIVSGLSTGPLYAFNSDGSSLTGWPVTTTHGGAAYPMVLNSDVVTVNWGTCSPCYADIAAFSSNGTPIFQHTISNYATSPPSGSQLTISNNWGIFNEEEDFKVHGYSLSTGNPLTGWPFSASQSQEYHTPAIADLFNDGHLEIVSASSTGNGQFRVVALHEDGSLVSGWSNILYNGYVDTYPVIGDIDGDGNKEIILLTSGSSPGIVVLNANGTLKRSWQLTGTIFYGTAPALADLTGSGIPDIIVQANDYINVTDGYGTPLSGWPVAISNAWSGNSSPVVGDVDGDNQPEIVFTTQVAGSSTNGYLHVMNKSGQYLPGFPMALNIGAGAVPAIADLKQTGHNDIIVSGAYWNGTPGNYDKVWAFDLDRDSANIVDGPVQWGQFMHDSHHTGTYVPPPPLGIMHTGNSTPKEFVLSQNYPNPFNPSTVISYQLAISSYVSLKIYDVTGKEIANLVSQKQNAGKYEVTWDAANFPSGVYFYQLTSGNFMLSMKMLLLK